MKTIKAEEGKVFRRIVDKVLFGNEIHLGYLYYLHGVVLETPVMELPEHFEEIDDPELDRPIIAEGIGTILGPSLKKVTLRDYLELENKVNKLIEHIQWQD